MDMDVQEFYRGRAFCAYEHLGAHVVEEGTVFRTFAPAADGITILRDGFETPMERVSDGNFWEGYVPGAKPGDAYEYRIYRNGGYVDHCDPYGYGMELRPAHRSIIRDLGAYRFCDDEWMASRTPCVGEALNIYELHAGSWRKRKDGPVDPEKDGGVSRIVEPEDWYSYDELAEPLIDYLREGGYTHVEFMPLAEHPVDQSWGYQDTGFYAPTSRYGTIDQLKELVDRLHQAGIGAIIDFVPVHFATDAYALRDYDGTALFEYPNDAVGRLRVGELQLHALAGGDLQLPAVLRALLAQGAPLRRASHGRHQPHHLLAGRPGKGRERQCRRLHQDDELRPQVARPRLHAVRRGLDRLPRAPRARWARVGSASTTSGTWAG
ncbi:MAG: alpha-amylase family glycosyl hydrolase [Atopobiaceae bacterium]|jgi:1,4-alpha-glucan branching enzyme|nr:alpha-amylase family glycosyl hydrolase [Atopobiaceae bacterium]